MHLLSEKNCCQVTMKVYFHYTVCESCDMCMSISYVDRKGVDTLTRVYKNKDECSKKIHSYI